MTDSGRPELERSPAWVQNVDRPHEWAVEHSWLLSAIFELFDRDGDWPRVEAVQRVLADTSSAQAVAVAQLAIEIPAELGARHTDRFTLTTRALSHCAGAGSLLVSFVEVIREAALAYRAGDEDQPAVLSGFAVKQSLGLDDATYVRVSRLVFHEPWFFGSGGGNVEDDWRYHVRAEILLAEDIQDIADYLDVVACYRFGPPEIEKPAAARSSQRPQDWLAKRDVTVRDLLVIAIAGAVVAGVVLWLLLG